MTKKLIQEQDKSAIEHVLSVTQRKGASSQFQREILNMVREYADSFLQNLERGCVRSYQTLYEAMGKPMSSRAIQGYGYECLKKSALQTISPHIQQAIAAFELIQNAEGLAACGEALANDKQLFGAKQVYDKITLILRK